MNTTQTTTASNEQEVTLRTLTSDIASLQRGSATPQPEQLTAHFASSAADTATNEPSHHTGIMHIIVTIVILLAIGVAVYWFVTPYLIGTGPAVL